MNPSSPSTPRFVALDIHKHYALVAAVDAQGQPLGKVPLK